MGNGEESDASEKEQRPQPADPAWVVAVGPWECAGEEDERRSENHRGQSGDGARDQSPTGAGDPGRSLVSQDPGLVVDPDEDLGECGEYEDDAEGDIVHVSFVPDGAVKERQRMLNRLV